MDIRLASKSFEQWVGAQTPLVRGDLRHKHAAMKLDPFSFLRATYYRWAQLFLTMDAAASRAPEVLAVGDLHLENFGTWRDSLGRLAWGINDFDEAYPLPFTHDLIRLAASALVAIDLDHLRLTPKSACRAIFDGYREAIESHGRPFVIGDEHRWFKPILQNLQRDPGLFWDRLRALPRERNPPPPAARAALKSVMPDPRLAYELHHRIAGLGNLGKARFTAIATWQGGPVARESKIVTLSAAAWAENKTDGPYYADILTRAVRCPDPCLTVLGSWVTRRLAPDCRRIELDSLIRVPDEQWLLHAMGFETANVHLGTPGARKSISRHLKKFSRRELKKSAVAMQELLAKDFRTWRKNV